MRMRLQTWLREAILFVAMVLMECGGVAMTTISKVAMNQGMSNFVFLVYYNTLGLLIFLPIYFFHIFRNRTPPLTLPLLCRFFLLGILGKSLVLFGYLGIQYSSPTLHAALNNLTPVFTFLLVIIFRMEKIDMRSPSSKAKCLGTIVAVSGAILMTIYKGTPVFSPSTSSHQFLLFETSNWILGSLLLTIAFIFGSLWLTLQAKTVEEYPDIMTVVFFYVFFGTIQCAVLGLFVERNPSAWTLHPNMEMVAIVYSAVFSTLVRNNVVTWCLNQKGPLYVSMFGPLGMVIAAIGGIMFLGDILYVGSIIGGLIIAVGFYTVMWAQTKDNNIIEEDTLPKSEVIRTQNTPLLLNFPAQEQES